MWQGAFSSAECSLFCRVRGEDGVEGGVGGDSIGGLVFEEVARGALPGARTEILFAPAHEGVCARKSVVGRRSRWSCFAAACYACGRVFCSADHPLHCTIGRFSAAGRIMYCYRRNTRLRSHSNCKISRSSYRNCLTTNSCRCSC